MAATSAGTSRTLRRPDTDPFSDEDEPSTWEKAFTSDQAHVGESPASAPEGDAEGRGPEAVTPGSESADAPRDDALSADDLTEVEPSGESQTATETSWSAPSTEPDSTARAAKKGRVRGGWRAHLWSMVAGVVVVALLAGVVVFAVQWFGHRSEDAQRDAASAAARQMAVNLTSLNYNQIDGQMKQIIDQTTGDFRNQFTQSADPFSNVVRTAKVETTSDVVASGVQSSGDGKARVLVAVRSTVKNAETPQPQVRNYRMALDLQDQADQWLTSNVEFVP